MMRSTPLKRTGFKSAPEMRKDARKAMSDYRDAVLLLFMAGREERLEARAARAIASARPRAAVMVNAASGARPVPKETALRSERYRRAVASLPCAYCGIEGYSQHAHENEGKGARTKLDDRRAMPLCCARPGIEGCHAAFDQYRLIPGGREAHIALGRALAAMTRAHLNSMGLWPAGIPQYQAREDA